MFLVYFILFILLFWFSITLTLFVCLAFSKVIDATRIQRFLLFILLPGKYVHQIYTFKSSDISGSAINVEYVMNDIVYEAHDKSYYIAVWKAAK